MGPGRLDEARPELDSILTMKVLSAWWVWMAWSWLCFLVRARRSGTPEDMRALLQKWLAGRAWEHSLAFGILLAAFFWLGLSWSFYGALVLTKPWAGALARAVSLLAAIFAACIALLNSGLAASIPSQPQREWKAAAYMAMAFAPQCIGAL